jgi:glycosyltransferase 2 family protein
VVLSLRHSPRLQLVLRVLLLLAGFGLGVGLVVYLLSSVDLGQLGNDFSNADYRLLALALVAFAVNLLMKVPRWALLYGEDAPGWDALFGGINVGYAVNALLPARLGDLVRAYWVRDRSGISMVRTLATIAVERAADGVAVLIMFLAVAPTVALPASTRRAALVAGGLFVAALVVMVVLAFFSTGENWFSRFLTRLEDGRGAIVSRTVRQVSTGLSALRSRRSIALLLLYTAIIWGSNAVLLWLIILAFHVDAPFAAGVLGNAVVSLGMTVPSTPGYIGVFDGLIVLTLGLYNVARTPALAVAFMFHAIGFIPVTVIGIIYIARAGMGRTLQMVRTRPASPDS